MKEIKRAPDIKVGFFHFLFSMSYVQLNLHIYLPFRTDDLSVYLSLTLITESITTLLLISLHKGIADLTTKFNSVCTVL